MAPVIRALAGLPAAEVERVAATLPLRVTSERGRTEFMMVSLARREDGGLAAYPIAKGSGAVTAFSQADGFITIGQHQESLAAGTSVEVQLHRELAAAGGSGRSSAAIASGSTSSRHGFRRRGSRSSCSMSAAWAGWPPPSAGNATSRPSISWIRRPAAYNRPLLTPELELIEGYRRLQGIVFRKGDGRFMGRSVQEAIAAAAADPDCIMVNRNAGSGTRILTDRLLAGAKPSGYWSQPKSHNAVAVAVAQNRADWGVAIESVARQYDLGFLPLQDEHYDFAVPKARLDRPAVQRFRAVLQDASVRAALTALGFRIVGPGGAS